MKKLTIIFVFAFKCAVIFGQVDDCKLTADFDELYRYGKSNEALDVWVNFSKKCKAKTYEEFSKGERILLYELENATYENKIAKLNELQNYYSEMQQLFPNHSQNLYSKKALIIQQFGKISELELNKLFLEAFEKKDQFEDPLALKLYFDNFLLLQSKQKNIDFNVLLEGYLRVKIKAKQNSIQFPTKAVEFENLIQYVNTNPLVVKWVTCDTMTKFVQNNLDNKPKEYELYIGLTIDLFEKCGNNSILLKMAQNTYDLKETSLSAYYLGLCKFEKESIESAMPYLLASVDLEPDAFKKSEIASKIAVMIMGADPGKAGLFMKKAIENDPKNPNHYLMMGAIYETSIPFCNFEGKQADAVYYLASQVVLEAAKVDAKYTAASQNKSAEFKAKMKTPTAKGKKNSVELGCWINQSVNW